MSATTVGRVTAPERHDLLSWITTTDHKRIGVLYMGTTLLFMLVAGVLAIAMRTQLAQPGETLLKAHTFNEIFTLHGTAMIFLVISTFAIGLANFLVPLQIGAPDLAFPRLNATTYWMFLFGGIIIFAGAATNEGAASTGWFAYAPLSEINVSTGLGQDFWIIGVALVSEATILTSVNLLTTIFLFRAPGMTMWRIPIFSWEMIATALLVLMAFPSLTGALLLLFLDRRFGGHAFDPAAGGNAILYQHLFWFFGHPEVYVMILPYFGVVSEVIATFSGKPLFGYTGMVLSAFAIAGLSMGVWAHHMFTTGAVNNPFFSFVSFLIAVPTGIKFFNWICTMWGGSVRFTTAMLFSLAFLMNFVVGGVTGVMVASPPIDYHAQDSYFVVAHFHYTLGGGSFFAVFSALYYWWPKIFGYKLREGLGKAHFWLTFIGFNLTFMPMFFMGIFGMTRRIYTYPAMGDLASLNLLATIGSYILVLGAIVFVVDIVLSARNHEPAGDDPWDGQTLEWATSSPPPEHNFHAIPPIRSAHPIFDRNHPKEAAGIEQ